jgi:hypothetical protein
LGHSKHSIALIKELMMKTIILGSLMLAFLGCTNQEVYNAIQTNQKNQCDQLSGVQRETCIKQLAPDYTTYERERQELEK